MPAPPAQPHDSQAIIVVVLFIVGLCVVYWRTAIRVFTIIIIALLVLGVIESMNSLR